jgi:hypothetical protein
MRYETEAKDRLGSFGYYYPDNINGFCGDAESGYLLFHERIVGHSKYPGSTIPGPILAPPDKPLYEKHPQRDGGVVEIFKQKIPYTNGIRFRWETAPPPDTP